ncbi:MAG TPA: ATP phosphoribosyltransferase [Polyangia bacterium]
MITLAVPKGRVQDEAIALFAKAGVDLSPIQDGSRRLVFELPVAGLRVLVVRDADVPTYVEHGAADLGIAGRDVLEERGSDLYEPLDLKIGACRLAVAEPIDPPARAVDDEGRGAHLRYCTKFPNLTRRHLEKSGTVADVIKLSGSVELGPLTGLCDRIVDLVSSGETLRQHRLREIETILEVTSRLVVNRAAWKVRRRPIDALLARLGGVV